MSASGVTVELAGPGDREDWSEFVASRSAATVGHLFAWREVIGRSYGHRAPFLIGRQGGECVGVLPLVEMRDLLFRRRLVSLPFLDRGGILARTRPAAAALWRRALELAAERGAGGVELRGGLPEAEEEPPPTRRFRLVLGLPESVDELWAKLGPKVRNQVRKSEKSGLETRPAGAAGLDSFYEVFSENMLDLGSPVHARAFFDQILEQLGERAEVWLTVAAGGRVVAGGVALSLRGEIVVPWAASRRAARPHCPNHSLYWAILRDAVGRRAARFDFGRSWADSGTFHFKKQWGAVPRPLVWGAYDRRGRRREERSLEPAAHGRLVALWRGLPAPLARRLGPVLRSRISN